MPGQKLNLNSLEARKQLLLAESELNRAGLLEAWHAWKSEAHRLARKARTVGSIASLAAVAVAAYSNLRRGTPGTDGGNGKSSWISNCLTGMRTGVSLWVALKSFFR